MIHTSIVIVASGGSRALVRCADSARRQTVSPADIYVATAAGTVPRTIVSSIERRVGASSVEGADRWEAANAAVARARGDAIVLVPAAFLLDRRTAERCGDPLAKGEAAAAVPDLAIVTAEGRLVGEVRFDTRLHTAIANPRAVPPVVVFTRALWKDIGPLDPSFGDRAAYEWWVRILSSRCRVSAIEQALVRFEAAGDAWWPPVQDGEQWLDAYRRILERHRAAVERDGEAVLIERELSFGRLLDRHRDVTRRRDADLAELDRRRSETAHHRAYLAHHGREALDWGDWRRPDPISRDWGYDRGQPIDRHYIEAFLAAHSSDVRGSLLEVQEDDLTSRFGGPRVERRAVLDIDEGNPRATVVTDLRAADLPDCSFDCIILTQTLHVIDDMTSALSECERLLRPGGVLLATLPCASRVCLEYGMEGDLWRVTADGARALVEPVFGAAHIECTTYGSVLTNVAFLHGLARGELTAAEFSATDPYHPVLVGVRARKPIAGRHSASARRSGVVLLYHRIQDVDDVHGLNVPASLFEAQLEMLAAECCPMPLDQLLSGARDGLPERAVAVTFDDGYLDTLEVAAPLLERFGVPATVFATTRWLDRAGEYWWDALERIVLSSSAPPSLSLDVNGRTVLFETSSGEARLETHRRLHDCLVHATLEDRERLMSAIAAWHGEGRPAYRAVTGEELRRLGETPAVTIGAHSVNHLALPDQPVDVVEREVRQSGAALERLLGRRVDLFAYPYGAADDRVADVVRSSYRWGLTCDERPLGSSFDAARVPRVEVTRRQAPDILRALVSSRRASG